MARVNLLVTSYIRELGERDESVKIQVSFCIRKLKERDKRLKIQVNSCMQKFKSIAMSLICSVQCLTSHAVSACSLIFTLYP